MKKFLLSIGTVTMLGVVVSFLVTVQAINQESFWSDAARGSMAEIMASEMALQKSQNESVRQFAQQMITDHTAASTELKSLASGKSVTLPDETSTKQKSAIDKLGQKSGADFDSAYMKMMVKDHENMVKMFQKQAEGGTDDDAKSFAARTLPTLQSHLQMARTISGTMSGRTNENRGTDTNRSDSNRSNMNRSNSNRSNSNAHDMNSNMHMNMNSNMHMNMNSNMHMNMNSNMDMNSNTNMNTR